MSTYKSKQGIYILSIISILFFTVSCSKKAEEPLQSEPTLEQIIAEIKFPAPDTIIGKVGDSTIDFKTIEEKMTPTIQKSEKLFSPEQMKIFKKQIISEYLKIWAELKLFSIAADKDNITVDENDVENIMTYFKIQTPPTLTTEEYLNMLSFDRDDLRRIVKAQKYVMKYALLDLSDEALKKYYEEKKNSIIIPEKVNLFALVIDIAPEDTDEQKQEKRQKAEEALEKIKSGKDFSEIAAEYSTDPILINNKGNMGYMDVASLSEPFLSAFKKLKVGEHSEILETQNGFWIIKVNKIIKSYGDDFEKDKKYIIERAKIFHYNKNKNDLIAKLSKEIPFEINPDGIENLKPEEADTKIPSQSEEAKTENVSSENN